MLTHSLVDLGTAAAGGDEAALLQWDDGADGSTASLQRSGAPRRCRSSLSRFYAAKSQSFCCMSDLQANPFSQSTAIVLAKKRSLSTFSSLTSSEAFGLLGEEQPADDAEQQAAPKRVARAPAGATPTPVLAAADSMGSMPMPSLARHSWDGSQATTHTALLATSGDDDSDDDQESSGSGLMMTAQPGKRLPRGHSPAGASSDSGGSQQGRHAASAGSCWLEPCGSTAATLPAVACDGLCVALHAAALASSGPRQLLCFAEP